MSENKTKFSSVYDISISIIVVVGAIAIYKTKNLSLIFFIISSVISVLAIESIIKKEIKLWDMMIKSTDNTVLYLTVLFSYFAFISVFLWLAIMNYVDQ